MTRTECENRITELFKEIVKTYLEYDPEGRYFTACFIDGSIQGNNDWYEPEKKKVIDFYREIKGARK